MMKMRDTIYDGWLLVGLSNKAAKVLADLRLETPAEVADMGMDEIAKMQGIGPVTLREIAPYASGKHPQCRVSGLLPEV